MENEFAKVMSERTDEELIKIVTIERGSYNPTAIEAADSEIEKRNIDTSEFEKIKEKATVEKEQKQKVDSNVVGSGIRFLNFIIDFIIWLIIAGILTFPLSAKDGNQMLLGYVIMFATFIGYYAIMEIKFQKTVGKFVTKTRVVKMNGEKPENSDIISRTFCRLIPFDRISFLFTKNGIHDFLSKTKVVKDTVE
ncbi:RDD family protein [Aequorivita lipolytica]|jgi:uncharacterized RDD family membrane protein YckC|uniref:RDD family protein n=1 Tax=Aequorivita lipolytica TaxID=153267 RepID=A0A5C6YL07_9FLAO|nr:RDD family protein [Aequorivita lipolytica]TXD67740.1 RDD family protein [Aequorivita lipolytica]SRX54168.1 hypothetical protein AEQU2_03072 [Aequorivita lipolytica]